MDAVRDGVLFYGFQLENVEDRMNSMEVRWQFEGEGMRARLSNDFEWAEELFCEFSCRACSFDVLGTEEDFVTYFEQRSRILMLVR